ncbi:MAG: aspartate aminotransferase family protein, partial [Sphingomonadales bacterium]|nr:aspartate aminotransferase family protein [Sphingomonadales bacterium]
MDSSEFRKHAHTLVDWMADYMDNVGDFPVRSQVKPGDVAAQLTAKPPARGEDMTAIFDDFKSIVVPGMTHWQHPSFFAFFPANVSPPSVLAEMLIATMGAQCMMWETSPAATEMETRVMSWLGGMIGLPDNFSGVIQDTASTATFCAILAAREKATDWRVNDEGLAGAEQLTFYASVENHSSIEKAIKMAGIGKNNLRLIPSDDNFAMNVDALKAAISDDRAKGFTPAGIVACIGGTALGGMDDLTAVGAVAEAEGLYLHVDAAWAGSALICPENQHLIKGIEKADSFVFNPHKWMFTNFDCTAHFVKDTDTLVRTLTILPEYLKTREGSAVIDYRDWGVQLGRRFRALKLWFVIR